ncbi:MAG TPA: pyruvate dehydrogenase complex dihydrolipoamide acetyltransferase [Polyangia bacterium]|jgi:pyruvate dehydrogenase E2 component (dihydrolipoamide acetyltransferase)
MAQILDMPQLSDTMREGVLRKWRKNEGDKIAPGELLAEVETDKATMDFEAFDEGVLLKRLIGDGTTVPVGSPIAIIGNTGEDITALVEQAKARSAGAGKKPAAPAPAAKAPEAKPATAPAPAPAAATAVPNGAARAAAPARPAAPAPAARSAAAPVAAAGKVLASPLARKLATDLGVDLRSVQGTGPGGRIVERDVKAAADGGSSAASAPANDTAPAQAEAEAAPAKPAAPLPDKIIADRRAEARPAAPVPSDDVEKPLSMMRRTIARRLLESKTTIPHFYLTADVDMDAAMEFRSQVSQVHNAKLSVNDLVIKAAALALRRIPEANASFTEEAIIEHARVDVGMAVAIEDGLVTPVIRDADHKTLGQISNEAHEMAKRARDRKLRPEEMTGATFSVSNLGMLGIRDFCAIINPPEAAILAVGAVRKEPVVKGDKIVIGQRMSLTLSCDHRVIDGALGAKLLQAITSILERPIALAF